MRVRTSICGVLLLGTVLTIAISCIGGERQPKASPPLIPDPSFERTRPRDQFGRVFEQWDGWKWEGDCEFRVSAIAHSGKSSCLIFCGGVGKIRMSRQLEEVPPGRYRITAFLRGLDIGVGQWDQSTELAFGEDYFSLKKSGSFGWTPLTFVVEVKGPHKQLGGPSFGLLAPGYLWVDDVHLERVGNEVPLTASPVWGQEERPIPLLGPGVTPFARCPECGYKIPVHVATCPVCGAAQGQGRDAKAAAGGAKVKLLASFDGDDELLGTPSGGAVVARPGSDIGRSLRLASGFSAFDRPQDWRGYDFLVLDTFTEAHAPLFLDLELHDRQTTDYWTRVNTRLAVPPGRGRLRIPLDQLYVGEKSRPGRRPLLDALTRVVFAIGDAPAAPLFIDNVRLERGEDYRNYQFDGLFAFDFGLASSPVMPGFTRIDASTAYNSGRGYGLKDAKVWRSFDGLQPDPLYQDFICIESGGLAVDVPNGDYRVFVNLDSPSGYWGEYQRFRERAVYAEGREAVRETMTFDGLKQKYFRYWNTEDRLSDNTFDKYVKGYFGERTFDVTVSDGTLNLDFEGRDWANSVSAVVIYPQRRAAEGARFLAFVEKQRRTYFDIAYTRVTKAGTGAPLAKDDPAVAQKYVVFSRDYMQDVFQNDRPTPAERSRPVDAIAFAGELEPLTFAVHALEQIGDVAVSVSDLVGPATITKDRLQIGYVSSRLTRLTPDGTVYTIAPRFVVPRSTAAVDPGTSRRFWLTVEVPSAAPPGVYSGVITVTPKSAPATTIPVRLRVFPGTLDPVDIPVGPWGHTIDIPWIDGDPLMTDWNQRMARASLRLLRRYGFTTFTGLPVLSYGGFQDGKPSLDFSVGDAQMAMAREEGFKMPVVSYVRINGLELYQRDEWALQHSPFQRYADFVRAVFGAIDAHGKQHNWLPVYWNIGDEPLGDALVAATANAKEYHQAFPDGPVRFTAATSFTGSDTKDPHFVFAQQLSLANLNSHDEQSVRLLRKAGTDWAFYNGQDRWTYGVYMYKAAVQFGMKLRLGWHWNMSAGDPFYALDCREDDYAWAAAIPTGELMTTVELERLREGLDDYRMLLTLARLAREKRDAVAQALIKERLDAFALGQREHDALFPPADWTAFRLKLALEIERLRQGGAR